MTQNDLNRLRQHHNAAIGLFVAFWIFVVIAMLAFGFLNLSERTQDSLIGTVFGGAIVLCLLQFTKRCPACRANLGWQTARGIPRRCHKCGTALQVDPDE